MPKHTSRRHFFKQSSCAAIASTTLLSTLTNLKFMNAASLANSSTLLGGDYKALVCILMQGGNDSFNMLIPKESSQYNIYKKTRTEIALPHSSILGLNGTDFGLHPSMNGIKSLFDSGELSFISNVGTLIEPVDKAQVRNEHNLPLGLFSHSDQVQQWQTSVPHDRASIGWGGKIADMMQSLNGNSQISMNVSLSGSNIFQTGNSSVEYALDRDDGVISIINYDNPWNSDFIGLRNQAIDNMVDANYQDVFKQTYVDVIKNSVDASASVTEALNDATYLDDLFPDTEFSDSLKMIARMISSREKLGVKRQIFFVESSGWDHHDELLVSQATMLQEFSEGMQAFNDALVRIDANDCVTTFTSSEFGRTLTYNGEGTDHAWGGNVMAMGGPVKGGQIFGEYPLLELGGINDVSENPMYSNGVMIPTTSVDEYFAELALWFGVQPSELSTIFPNIGNFYSAGSGSNPIGFLE